MAGIKNINVVSGTGNPVQMQDLQNLWSAINSLLRSTKTPISIVAGFATANNNTGTNIGEGIICYQGQAYYLAANSAKIGQYLYANTIQDEQRVYEDGTTRYTYQDYVVNAADNASASGIGTLIGRATATNLASWKVGVLSDGSVTAAMLADGAVTTPKLANGAVTAANIADGAVRSLQIGREAIKNGNIQDGQITGSKMADQSIPGSKLSNKTITETKIADKAITAGKIADATITASQIAAETITNEEIANKTIIANQKLEDGSIEEAQYGTASVSTRALQVNSVNTSALANTAVTTDKIKDDNVTPEKLAPSIRTSIPIQTQILDHNTSGRQTISEGNISILKIPVSASNQAVNIQLSEEDTDILVHHWPIFIYKDTEDAFGISVNGVCGRLEISLPTYSINCVLNVYSHTGYGLVVDVGQPNFIAK
jgi:hypothetical protein